MKNTEYKTRGGRIRKKIFYYITLIPAVAYIGLFFLLIISKLLVFSFTHYSGGLAENLTIQNYITVMTSPEFKDAYLRTLLFVLVVTPAQLVTGFITASILNKNFKGRGLLRGMFIIPLALPVLVTAATFFILFSKNGHINSLLMGGYSFFPRVIDYPISFVGSETGSFILTTFVKVWRDTPASMLILLAGMQSIDAIQYEAAETMGATKIQNTIYITIPLLMPSISSVLVLRSIEAWKEFVFPYILSPSYPVLSVLVDRYYNQMRNPGLTAVVGIILIISILVFCWIMKKIVYLINRYLVRA